MSLRHIISSSDLGSWIRTTKEARTPGSLTLLVHRWIPQVLEGPLAKYDRRNDNLVFPAGSRSEYEHMADHLGLPPVYLHHFARRQATPVVLSNLEVDGRPRIGWSHNNSGTKLTEAGIICQSPDFPHSFTTAVLSHDPETKTTTGLLFYTTGKMHYMLNTIKALPRYAGEPLFLPSVVCDTFISRHRRQLQDVNAIISQVQQDTGLLDRFLLDRVLHFSGSNGPQRQHTFDDMHKMLVEQHARLTNGVATFIRRLCDSLVQAATELNRPESPTGRPIAEAMRRDFECYFQRLRLDMEEEEGHRQRLLQRIDMQLKVLYNLQQQRIAQEAKRDNDVMKAIAEATQRDSLEMKGIALLTMTFLPMTALASIFSMQSFFTLASDDSKLIVSNQFWIYWAVTIPITAGILVGWSIWKWLARRYRWYGRAVASFGTLPTPVDVGKAQSSKADAQATTVELAALPDFVESKRFTLIEGDPRVIRPPSPRPGPNEFHITHLRP